MNESFSILTVRWHNAPSLYYLASSGILKFMEQTMTKTASSTLGHRTKQGLIRFGIWGVFLFCLVPVLSVAADPVVEMPPMPGQVYHTQDQPESEEKKAELPPELQQIDEQINQDAAILSGDRSVASGQTTKPAVGAASPSGQHVAPVDTKKEGDVRVTPQNNADSSNAGLIALVAAVGAAAVFVLRRRGVKS